MTHPHRNLSVVPQLVFGRGSRRELDDIVAARRTGAAAIFLIDAAVQEMPWVRELPVREGDLRIFLPVLHEPRTSDVDALGERVRSFTSRPPDVIVGIGGGSVMDLAKAVSLLLTNHGSAAEYQGWDLVKAAGIYKIGMPTLSGTGAEVSRTAVLVGPERKLGINSDFTRFDQVILDPDLVADTPPGQRFHTGMDCYFQGVEVLHGRFVNEFSRAYAEKSIDLCRSLFLQDIPPREADEKLMIASYFGGMSISHAQSGICHALANGLCFVLGTRYGVGNCIVFDQLEAYYPLEVAEFRRMATRNSIDLPTGVTRGLTESQFDEMIRVSLGMTRLWENALGPDWQSHMTADRARALYERM